MHEICFTRKSLAHTKDLSLICKRYIIDVIMIDEQDPWRDNIEIYLIFINDAPRYDAWHPMCKIYF